MCNCGRTNQIFSSYVGEGHKEWRGGRSGGAARGDFLTGGARRRDCCSAAHEERGVRGQRGRRRLEVDVLDGEDLGRDALGLVGLAVLGDDVGARRRAELKRCGSAAARFKLYADSVTALFVWG